MGSLDRLGWVEGFSVDPEGMVIGVRSNSMPLLGRIQREVLLPEWSVRPFRFHFLFSLFVGGERGRGRRAFTLLYDGTDRMARSMDVEEVYQVFEQRFHEKIASFSYHKISLNALALGINGKAHLYLGPAAEAAARADVWRGQGGRLLAPSFAMIDEAGLVYPYHNRSSIEARLGLPRAPEALPLSRVWVAGGEGQLTRAQCAFALFQALRNVFDGPKSFRTLGRLVQEREVSGSRFPLSG